MVVDDEVDPAVQAILDAAAARTTDQAARVDVDARSLPAALATAATDGRAPVIAEVKPTSPTTDGTRDDDPVELARAMVEGGAAALSVLTEPEHFDGSPEALRRVRAAVDVPVLRKDFILDAAQLDVVAADVVLLIARFVDDLDALLAAARDRGFQVLVEVHTAAEFEAAVEAGARIVGVNNRDLAALSVDLGTTERVLDAVSIPDDVTVIAESGIQTPADVSRMRAAGGDGLLIGSAIMDHDADTTGSPIDAVRANTRRLTRSETGETRMTPEDG
jgi:indole-3-glycerol phosphate synthase